MSSIGLCPLNEFLVLRDAVPGTPLDKSSLVWLHTLVLFGRKYKIDEILSHLESIREEGMNYFVFDPATKALTMSEAEPSHWYSASRCTQCPGRITHFTLSNMGLCLNCKKDDLLSTGIHKGSSVVSVALSYDLSADSTISLYDASRVIQCRETLCEHCGEGIDKGMRGQWIEGWWEGSLCAACIMVTQKEAIPLAMSGKDSSPLSLTIRNIFYHFHERSGSQVVGFGKHASKTRTEVVSKYGAYIDWCKTCTTCPYEMKQLLNYAELHSILVSLK